MNHISNSAPTRHPEETLRLVELQCQIATMLIGIQFQEGETQTHHPMLAISLPNGHVLQACGDPDLPWLLFEISREVGEGGSKFDFEGCLSACHAFTDKLSGGEAVDLVRKYAALAAVADERNKP